MNREQKAAMRDAVSGVAPTAVVRYHGKPKNAPSVNIDGISFRAWGEFVSIACKTDDHDSILDAVKPWRDATGLSLHWQT